MLIPQETLPTDSEVQGRGEVHRKPHMAKEGSAMCVLRQLTLVMMTPINIIPSDLPIIGTLLLYPNNS